MPEKACKTIYQPRAAVGQCLWSELIRPAQAKPDLEPCLTQIFILFSRELIHRQRVSHHWTECLIGARFFRCPTHGPAGQKRRLAVSHSRNGGRA
jgi:hypothetical protein